MRRILTLLAFISISYTGKTQVPLLEHPDLLEKIKSGLHYTYSTDFDKTRTILSGLNKEIPGHPVIYFMDALLIYWENYPLTPEHPLSESFIEKLEQTTARGKSMLEKDSSSLEGLFFDLFARALYSEYWADNGKPGKVFPYLNSMYHQTLKGMTLQDRFKEFYFTSGLYNYYMEAYPEKHPAYKPIKVLFKAGNKEKGLEMLIHCAENSIYVKNEARSFLSFIYMNYESDPAKASEYAADLYREFPRNPLYAGKYAEILIFNKKYPVAEIIVNNLRGLPGEFAKMEYHLYKGILDEKYRGNSQSAFTEYQKALELASGYGKAGDTFNAICWMGLGRYYHAKKDHATANKYFRMAQNATSYEYVLNDK